MARVRHAGCGALQGKGKAAKDEGGAVRGSDFDRVKVNRKQAELAPRDRYDVPNWGKRGGGERGCMRGGKKYSVAWFNNKPRFSPYSH